MPPAHLDHPIAQRLPLRGSQARHRKRLDTCSPGAPRVPPPLQGKTERIKVARVEVLPQLDARCSLQPLLRQQDEMRTPTAERGEYGGALRREKEAVGPGDEEAPAQRLDGLADTAGVVGLECPPPASEEAGACEKRRRECPREDRRGEHDEWKGLRLPRFPSAGCGCACSPQVGGARRAKPELPVISQLCAIGL